MSDPNAPQNPDPNNPAGQQPPQQPQYGQQPPQQPQYSQQPPQQPYGQPQYAPAPGQPLSPESDKTAAMWAHIGGIVGFLPSLIIWLIFKDRGPRTNVEAKEALNWQITFTIGIVALWIIDAIFTGIFFATGLWGLIWIFSLLIWAWWILNIVFSIMGGVRVSGGGSYRYPFNFRFIK